ncbi:MAG TPA: HAMP domain-containing sensor histidine kinase [Rhizomicrobium sp.]|nr:HAMP domain-containing sensor histidine kinase [Rhizomicrobium sp.]
MRIRFIHTEGFRIAAIFVAIFALAAAALAASVLVIVQREFRDQIVQFANADIAAVKNGYRTEGEAEAREVIEQRMTAEGASDFILLQRDGKRLAGNLKAMPPRTGIFTVPGIRRRHRILGVATYIAPGLYIFSGSDLYPARLAREHIVQFLIWIFAGAVLLAVLGGVFVSRNLLRRTDAIARACRAIMNGNMKTRVPVRGTEDELDRLAQTINAMLDRIAALMENVRQVTNDIAHDLRTPVSHLRHRLEHARLQLSAPADYDKALESAIATSDEILALFAALLRIAQIEGGARRAGFALVELTDLLHQLRDMFGPVADDSGHVLTLTLAQPAAIRGDRELLVQLFSNLIENAIVHTPAGTRIEIGLRVDKDFAIVSVSDDGPGVPEEEHEKLFQPLYRREASRSQPGHGLGLALVNAITDLHSGRIVLRKTVQPGLCVEVAFPLGGDVQAPQAIEVGNL